MLAGQAMDYHLLGLAGAKTQQPPEPVTPYKVCLGILLKEYLLLHRQNVFTAVQRKAFCQLSLRLIQGADKKLAEPLSLLLNQPEGHVSESLLHAWKCGLVNVVRHEVSGLMEAMELIEKLLQPDARGIVAMHKNSVSGLFLRRLLLQFEKMSFSEVSSLSHKMKVFYANGFELMKQVSFPKQLKSESQTDKDMSLDQSAMSLDSPTPADDEDEENDESIDLDGTAMETAMQLIRDTEEEEDQMMTSKRQAKFYIARQVEYLLHSEARADSYSSISSMTEKIHQMSPDLSEAYYLQYLNCLRIRDFSGAITNLNRAFHEERPYNAQEAARMMNLFHGGEETEGSKSFRHAGMSLAFLHAHFGHKELAVTALKEVIRLGQEANDHVFLQQAIGWLIKVDEYTIEEQYNLVQNFIAKCGDDASMKAFGCQQLAQLLAQRGESPARVLEEVTKSEILNVPSPDVEIITTAYSLKAAAWAQYGRAMMSTIVSQLMLNMHSGQYRSSLSSPEGRVMQGESAIFAMLNVARALFDRGEDKLCDKVVNCTRSYFYSPLTPFGSLVRQTELELAFQRSLFTTNWVDAERILGELKVIDRIEEKLLSVELLLWRGEGNKVEDLLRLIEFERFSRVQHVRYHISNAEWYCLNSSYSAALQPLMSALSLCIKYHLEYYQAVVLLHIAHVHLQLGQVDDATGIIKSIFPMLLSHHSLFEVGRAHLLKAKCQVASVRLNLIVEPNTRTKTLREAISSLKSAIVAFKKVKANARVKDCLYMMARLYHATDWIAERNQAAAEFKKIEEAYPTSITSHLAKML